MTIIIRKATEDDLAALIKLVPEEAPLSLEKAKTLLPRMSLYTNYTLFVVFKDSVLVAGFSLLIMDNLAHEGTPSGMIDDLLCASSLASKESIVEPIMSFALEQCKKQACYKLCVANPQLLVHQLLASESPAFSQHGLCFVKELGKKDKPQKAFSLVNNGVQLREAIKGDLASILALYKQPDMDDKVLSIEAAGELYLKMRANPHYKIYVAQVGQDILATFALLMVPSLVQQESYLAIIEDVMVSPKAQGKGVGKLMMSFALELAEKMDCYKLALSSNKKRETAHGFYRALGFVESGASLLVQAPVALVCAAEEKSAMCCLK